MSTVSNSLHDALIQKDGGSFWKTWNSKFKSKQKTASSIEGLHDDHTIDDQFADFFAKNSLEGKNQEATRTKLLTRLQGYIGDAN